MVLSVDDGFLDFPDPSQEELSPPFLRTLWWTFKKDSAVVDKYVQQGTSKFVPIDMSTLTANLSYSCSFPRSIYLKNADMQIVSQAQLGTSRNSLVTLRVYECVVIAARLGSEENRHLGMYHYYRDQDPNYTGVNKFISRLTQKIKELDIQPTDIEIELASARLTHSLLEIAHRISQANLPIQKISTQRVVQHESEWRMVADSNMSEQELIHFQAESIGVKVSIDQGIELFKDQ